MKDNGDADSRKVEAKLKIYFMFKHFNVNETAAGAGNNSRAMEADTILKTRESSKIQKSKGNVEIIGG